MTSEREIDYEALAQSAMRGMVRTVLARVAKSGLPGEHHFYIAFDTAAPGVAISKRLREKYPEEMTVVLQHRFWDLAVAEDHFEVKLTFDGVPERLVVPFAAVKVFFDPSVPYGLQFEASDLAGGGEGEMEAVQPHAGPAPAVARSESQGVRGAGSGRADKKPRAARRTRADKPGEPVAADAASKALPKQPAKIEPVPAANQDKVVSLDKFRKK